jgi:asparagine synthase (glutamine-hydrolysing)
MKNYNNREKGLLRKAMEGLLPEEILWRKKSPYPKTHNPLYKNKLANILKDIINDENQPLLNIVKKSELEKLLLSDNDEPWYGQLMTTPQTIAYFIQINYWLKKYKIKINLS